MDKSRAKWPLAVVILIFITLWLFHVGFFLIMLGFANEPGGRGGGITFYEFLEATRYIALTTVVGIGSVILWRRGYAIIAYLLCAITVVLSLDYIGFLGSWISQ